MQIRSKTRGEHFSQANNFNKKGERIVQKLSRNKSVLSLSAKHKPVAHASSGETIAFETFDCFSNRIATEDQLFSSVGWEDINPATGPLYIDDARIGDILKVDVLDIHLDAQAVTSTAPGNGVFGDRWEREVTRIVQVKGGKVRFNDRLELNASPMIGVIGTAPPEDEDIPTGTPGAHGGNMDCKKIGVGTSLYLPVNVDGALLAMGDVHAVMGDGEVSVCGIEIAAEITVRVSVVKGVSLPLPLLVDDAHVMTIYSAESLDEAADGAAHNMLDFATQQLGIEAHEAAMLLSAAADLCICQVVDPLKTCRMELPLWIVEQYGYRFP